MTPTAHAGGACLPCSAVICICFVPLQAHTGLIREQSCSVVLRLTVEVMHRKSTMADGSKYLQYMYPQTKAEADCEGEAS